MDATAAVSGRAREASGQMPAAFDRLFLREYARVAGIAYRVLGDRSEAEDVAQEVFLSFYRKHSADASYAAAWLHAAAAHTALNVIRGRKRRDQRETAAREEGPLADPEQAALVAEEREEVRRALARLPERTAALLALRHSGLSYAEVAAALGMNADQIGTRLRRAQEAFKEEVLRGRAK